MARLRTLLSASALAGALALGAPPAAAQATDAGGQTDRDRGGFNDWGLLGLLGLAGLMKRGKDDRDVHVRDTTRRP
jgi:hypothetical protein